MVNKNNRNSRDDKSSSGSRKPGDRNAPRARSTKSGDKDNGSEKRSDFKKRSPEGDDKRTFGRDREEKTFRAKPSGERGEGYQKREFKPRDSGKYAGKKEFGSKTARDRSFGDKPSGKDERGEGFQKREFKPRDSGKFSGKKEFDPKKSRDRGFGDKPFAREERGKGFKKDEGQAFKARPYEKGAEGDYKPKYTKKEWDDFKPSAGSSRDVAPRNKEGNDSRPFRQREENKPFEKKRASSTVLAPARKTNADKGLIRLNRYIANAGICSRRRADEFISAGVVSVNGEVITELGHKVDPAKDAVRYNGELLKREKKVYILLNKPKDYITTTDDPQERKTVMQLIDKATNERVYPVGRLDRNTTGLLLMTNDGDLADKLSHPKNGISKMYNVELDRSLSQGDLNKIAFGLELEDGLIKPDAISYVAGGTKKEIGIQIHSGKNRIVRRIFEHLGYNVDKLDRVVYGNLTKKDLPRGRWRYLEDHELVQIKHLIK
ncbi:23S rRNA pseudouridine2605 synthase [Pedobacter sp. UYP30]|uniref:pseudouridine synthase n=1 Tax=Pedobacter sp. UYP30 TaxID=1756400 RepID=UPI0033941CFA